MPSLTMKFTKVLFLTVVILSQFAPSSTIAQGWVFEDIGDGTKPTIYADGAAIHVAALKEDPSDGFLVYMAVDSTGAVSDTIIENYLYGPIDIITDGAGLPIVAFHHHLVGPEETRGDLGIARQDPDGVWTVDVTADPGHDGWDGTMVIDDSGVIHAVSTDPANGVEYNTFVNDTWTTQVIDPLPAMYQYGTDIGIDAAGDLHVTFFIDGSSTLKYAKLSAGVWTVEEIDTHGIFPSMILTADGPVIAYYKAARNDDAADSWPTSGEVMIAERNSTTGAWTSSSVAALGSVAAGVFSGARAIVDLQQDGQGVRHLAFGNDRIIRYGTYNGTNWSISTILDANEQSYPNLGQQVSLAIDDAGIAHIVTFRRTGGDNGIVIYGNNNNPVILPTVTCPADTTISCDVLITPENLGRPMDNEEFTRYEFVDTMMQSCPMDLVIQRSWIGYVEDEPMDTCTQLITVLVDPFEDFSIADSLTVDEVCLDDLDEVIQTDLALPCNIGIDSIAITEIERTCDHIIFNAEWVFADECRDTSVSLNQIITIQNRVVAKMGAPAITPNTGGANGSITLLPTCPFDSLMYKWEDGSTDSVLTNLNGGTYSVTITNAEGCFEMRTFEVVGSTADTMMMDTMMMDTMMMDTMMMDTMMMDTMMMDTMMMDTMMMDTMMMDTMMMDTMQMDTMMIDTMIMDTMMMDTMMMDTMMMDTSTMSGAIGSSLAIDMVDRSGNPLSIDTIYFMDTQSAMTKATVDGNGAYTVGRNLSEVAQVCIEKSGRPIQGLSATDLTKGLRIILQFTPGCPEDRVALDVSDDGNTTALDLGLMRGVLLDRIDGYPSGLIYKFVKSDEDIAPANVIGKCVEISDADRRAGELRVTAIKLGDLQCNE